MNTTDNVSLFPLGLKARGDQAQQALRSVKAFERVPSLDPKAHRPPPLTEHEIERVTAEQARQRAALQAAYENGRLTGYDEGERAGHVNGAWWHRLVGAFFGMVVLGAVLFAALQYGLHQGRLL